jgi:Ca2+-transporting ATPase
MDTARATAFHFMATGQLLLTCPARHTWMRPLPNRALHVAVVLGIVIQIAAAAVPVTADLLGGAALPPALWGLVFGMTLVAWGVIEAVAQVAWRHHGEPGR